MDLPGGIWDGAVLRRDFRFKPVIGELELLLDELARQAVSQPERVSQLLTAALDRLGGAAADWHRVHDLTVGDRQFLVRQLSAYLGFDRVWLNAICRTCGEGFDIQVQQSALPVKSAGEGYPRATVKLRGQEIRLRVPTGADQAAIAEFEEPMSVETALLARLIEGAPTFSLDGLAPEEFEGLEAAIEEVAPEVGTEALAHCPACEAENRVAVDPYLCLSAASGEILADIHALASSYHWSEAAILALPRHRRKRYLRQIDRQRGMVGLDDLPPDSG